jgi:hypothetical protein
LRLIAVLTAAGTESRGIAFGLQRRHPVAALQEA